jgi:hypothetical protein
MLASRKAELLFWASKVEEQATMYVKLAKDDPAEEELIIVMRALRRLQSVAKAKSTK